jgi:hypothetical protein
MAIIRNATTKETVFLNSKHVFGRSKTSSTPLSQTGLAPEHATIYWKNWSWYMKDHSNGGTLLNSKIISGEDVKLLNGNKIQFGSKDADIWEVINLLQPSSYLISLTHKNKALELRSCCTINDEKQEVSFCQSEDDKWLIKKDGAVTHLRNGQIIRINNEKWQFVENDILVNTSVVKTSDPVQFIFNLSIDEEYVNIKIAGGLAEFDMGYHCYNYVLLALARKRLDDYNNNYSRNDQGWMSIDDLLDDVQKEVCKTIDTYYLNLQIHRLRKQLSEISFNNNSQFANVIERRKGEIRFAHQYLKIIKDRKVVGEILPRTRFKDLIFSS